MKVLRQGNNVNYNHKRAHFCFLEALTKILSFLVHSLIFHLRTSSCKSNFMYSPQQKNSLLLSLPIAIILVDLGTYQLDHCPARVDVVVTLPFIAAGLPVRLLKLDFFRTHQEIQFLCVVDNPSSLTGCRCVLSLSLLFL